MKAIVTGIIIIVLSMWGLAVCSYNYVQEVLTGWVQVPGEVTDTNITSYRGTKSGTRYKVTWTVRYLVGGQTVHADECPHVTWSSWGDAGGAIRQRPIGTRVAVRYNPAQPKEMSVVGLPGWPLYTQFYVELGLGFFALLLLLLAFVIDRRARDPPCPVCGNGLVRTDLYCHTCDMKNPAAVGRYQAKNRGRGGSIWAPAVVLTGSGIWFLAHAISSPGKLGKPVEGEIFLIVGIWMAVAGGETFFYQAWRKECKKCRVMVRRNWKFCSECGLPLGGSNTSIPVS